MNARRSSSLAALLGEAGLTGRGGAAFDTATKVAAARTHGADLIVNACDGEIGSAKDAWVVARHLDELVAGAHAVAPSQRRVRFAAHRGSPSATRLAAAGLDVLEVPRRYVSSEETSLISLAHGQTARPLTKRTPPVTGGRDRDGRRLRPTLVLNAETTWRIAQIQQRGAAWFRSFGTPAQPGPRLVTIHGHVQASGVVETQAGVRLSSLLDAAGPHDVRSPVLLGGLAGCYLSAEQAGRAVWSDIDLAPHGARTGGGVIEVIDPRQCPLGHLTRLLSYAAGESAGQCGPCMFGLPSLAAEVIDLVARPDARRLAAVEARLRLVRDRGACRFPDGVSGLTASALSVFAGHLRLHVDSGCDRTASTSPTRNHRALST